MTNWIKMRRDLRHDTKVIRMARFLSSERCFMDWWSDPVRMQCKKNVTEIVTFSVVTRVTVTGLLDVWSSINETMDETGILPDTTLQDIDDIAEIPGFGEAMASVGWVVELDDGSLEFPNFAEYNTVSKKRAPAKTQAERAKAYRDRKRAETAPIKESASTITNVTSRHTEKRREEKRSDINIARSKSDEQERNSFSIFDDLPPCCEQLELAKQPTTDELDAALRHDPKAELVSRTRTSWKAIVEMAGMCNSGAEKFTAESLAEAYLTEAARRELRVFRKNQQENAPFLTAGTLRPDLESFIKLAKDSPGRNNLVLRNAAQTSGIDCKTEPTFNWRKAAGILNRTFVDIDDVWIRLPEPRRRKILTEGRDALNHPEKYGKAAHA